MNLLHCSSEEDWRNLIEWNKLQITSDSPAGNLSTYQILFLWFSWKLGALLILAFPCRLLKALVENFLRRAPALLQHLWYLWEMFLIYCFFFVIFLYSDVKKCLCILKCFVDLAGSERASQTLSAGARLKEGCHINRSLLTLGTVIRKLRFDWFSRLLFLPKICEF